MSETVDLFPGGLHGSRTSSAPNWEHVRFDVGCARCGHDLRGLREATCPACGLEFNWADAVPTERLVCAHCGYHLYGLTGTRCPECGESFTWEEVLADYRCIKNPLFEYQWRRRPIRSLVGTWFRAMRPKKFWSAVTMHDPPQVGPLLILCATLLVAFLATLIVVKGADGWLTYWSYWGRNGRFRSSWLGLIQYVYESAVSSEPYGWTMTVTVWFLSSLAMGRYQVRTAHVVRVWGYAAPVLVPFVPLVFLAYRWGGTSMFFQPRMTLPFAAVIFGVVAFVGWSIHFGYRVYLRMPHSLGIAVSSQFIAILTTCVFEIVLCGRLTESLLVQVLSSLGLW